MFFASWSPLCSYIYILTFECGSIRPSRTRAQSADIITCDPAKTRLRVHVERHCSVAELVAMSGTVRRCHWAFGRSILHQDEWVECLPRRCAHHGYRPRRRCYCPITSNAWVPSRYEVACIQAAPLDAVKRMTRTRTGMMRGVNCLRTGPTRMVQAIAGRFAPSTRHEWVGVWRASVWV